MPTESASLSLLSIFSLLSFFVVLIVSKYSDKIGKGILLDKDFGKPQAFHKDPVPRSGGLAGIISLLIFFSLYYVIFEKLFSNYIFLSLIIFFLGFSEDLKFKIKPKYRLFIMILVIIFFIIAFSVYIRGLDLVIINELMRNKIFSSAFILLCFLFIINGANLIDGFNGLLTIHLLIINLILLFINLNYGHQELVYVIAGQVVILVSFLFFNYPKAKMFLGDSGSYLFGSLVAFNTIHTNNLNPQISSFFFCIILFYLFFEVFFSFFRKLYLKKSPLKPDNSHLHMLLYNFLHSSKKFKESNYINSTLINLTYLFLILPATFFMHNPILCRYWFFGLLIVYLVFYYLLYSFEKKR